MLKHAVRRIAAVCLALALLLPLGVCAEGESGADTDAAESAPFTIDASSALLMEASTGKVLFEQNAHEARPPASVTKVMTLLLIMEALDAGKFALTDMVSVSANACGMGGSQVYLQEGEQMSVDDMLKAIAVASGNDAATAMAEFVAGSTEVFVTRMNERAKELGMNDTHFVNCHGLDADGHVTSAWDIALMSRELLKHKKIFDYTTIWMDTLRGGAFQLSNTNKMLKQYSGTNGLKTGSTSVAGYCMSATAERDGMELIAVIMNAPSGDTRFAEAGKLLDYGFANYALLRDDGQLTLPDVPVKKGREDFVALTAPMEEITVVVPKGSAGEIKREVTTAEELSAPVEAGQKVGEARYLLDGELLRKVDITAAEAVPRMTYFGYLGRLLNCLFHVDRDR